MTAAFVLSGGASLGAVQVGMLRALYEHDIRPDFIVGTSAGAINGAFIAERPETPATADELGAIWHDLHRSQVFPLSPLTGLLGLAGARSHLVGGSSLRRLIEGHLRHERLETMPIPLHVVSVDVLSGDELLLSSGPAVDAIMASAAIPGVLPPVAWGERSLMDGGVANNTPISHAVALGADRIYVLPTGHSCALDEPPRGALAMALHAINLLTQRRLADDIERHGATSDLIVLPPPCPLTITPIDFSRADELIERTYADASTFLDTMAPERAATRMRAHRRAPRHNGNVRTQARLGARREGGLPRVNGQRLSGGRPSG